MISCVDSGAARSVCPVDHCDEIPVLASARSRSGEHFKTASGARIANQGERIIEGCDDAGVTMALKYAVADVTDALDSVSQMCDAGNVVVFMRDGGYVAGPKGGKVTFKRVGDTYMRTTWVKRPKGTRRSTKREHTKPKQDTDGDIVMQDAAGAPFGRPGPQGP